MTMAADTTTSRVATILLSNAAEAYGAPAPGYDEPPCTRCGCALPAAEPGECTYDDCPLEGAGRDDQ
jgi:hypothetical protein